MNVELERRSTEVDYLLKTEPTVYSFADLERDKGKLSGMA